MISYTAEYDRVGVQKHWTGWTYLWLQTEDSFWSQKSRTKTRKLNKLKRKGVLQTWQNISTKRQRTWWHLWVSYYHKESLFQNTAFYCIYDSDQLKYVSLKSVTEIKCIQYVNPSRGPLCLKCKSVSTWVFF